MYPHQQVGVTAPLMGIELATIRRLIVGLDNGAIANIGEKCEMFVYMRTYQDTCQGS